MFSEIWMPQNSVSFVICNFFRFPEVLPEDLQALKKCTSLYITEKEALVLDEINLAICRGEYGRERFTTNDVIVDSNEFKDFFDLVNDTIICNSAIDLGFTDGGWLQINNTVSYYYIFNMWQTFGILEKFLSCRL